MAGQDVSAGDTYTCQGLHSLLDWMMDKNSRKYGDPLIVLALGLECLLTKHRDQEEYSAHGGEV